jgi:hypothetical protein
MNVIAAYDPYAALQAEKAVMHRPKKGRPRIEDGTQTIEARKPWLKLGMSRRTWYRRQAERRGKGA